MAEREQPQSIWSTKKVNSSSVVWEQLLFLLYMKYAVQNWLVKFQKQSTLLPQQTYDLVHQIQIQFTFKSSFG